MILLPSSAFLKIETVLKKERRRAGKLQSVHFIGEVEWTDVDGAIKKWAVGVEWQLLDAISPNFRIRSGGKKVPYATKN